MPKLNGKYDSFQISNCAKLQRNANAFTPHNFEYGDITFKIFSIEFLKKQKGRKLTALFTPQLAALTAFRQKPNIRFSWAIAKARNESLLLN